MPRYDFKTFNLKLKEFFPNSNFTLLSWNGIKKPCSFQCNDCGVIQSYTTADKILDRKRRGLKLICKDCEDTPQLKPRLEGIRKIENILKKKQTIVLTENITRLREKVIWKCLKCNHTFSRKPVDFLKNSKCPWCEGIFSKYTIEDIKERVKDKHGNEYTVLDNSYDCSSYATSKIKVRHNDCGFIYKTNAHSIIQGHGCPRCKTSSGEVLVRKFLEENGIKYIEQHRFLNTEISSLIFDFYLENERETFVIEYNGRQHYEPVDRFGGEEAFLLQKERDQRKKKFCEKNNIIFIEIPYNDHSILSNKLAQRLLGEGS